MQYLVISSPEMYTIGGACISDRCDAIALPAHPVPVPPPPQPRREQDTSHELLCIRSFVHVVNCRSLPPQQRR